MIQPLSLKRKQFHNMVYFIRPRNAGDTDGAFVYTNSGITKFQITDLKMVGVHAGEAANFTLNVYELQSGDLKVSRTFTEDVINRSFEVLNAVPGSTYKIEITSNTNNDCDGGFWITVDGYAFQ